VRFRTGGAGDAVDVGFAVSRFGAVVDLTLGVAFLTGVFSPLTCARMDENILMCRRIAWKDGLERKRFLLL
jgi:hypothetical protein